LHADARNAAGAIVLVADVDWSPHAVTMRVLDLDGATLTVSVCLARGTVRGFCRPKAQWMGGFAQIAATDGERVKSSHVSLRSASCGLPSRRRRVAPLSGCSRRRPRRLKFGNLLVTEYAAAGQKTNAFRRFKRKAGAASGHDVNNELGMLPVFELRSADIEFAAGYFAEQDVLRANAKLAGREAHRGRTVAASA
jgi:hypothetical protein